MRGCWKVFGLIHFAKSNQIEKIPEFLIGQAKKILPHLCIYIYMHINNNKEIWNSFGKDKTGFTGDIDKKVYSLYLKSRFPYLINKHFIQPMILWVGFIKQINQNAHLL